MLSRFAFSSLLILGGVFATGLTGAMVATPTRTSLPRQASERVGAGSPAIPVVETTVISPAKTVEPLRNATSANPIVEPGKVHWHKTTEAALAAAKVSNKPVLVFQMMGQLDHQFC